MRLAQPITGKDLGVRDIFVVPSCDKVPPPVVQFVDKAGKHISGKTTDGIDAGGHGLIRF